MLPSSGRPLVYELNPFAPFLVLLFAALLLEFIRRKFCVKTQPTFACTTWWGVSFWITFACVGLLWLSAEMYYQAFECRLSSQWRDEVNTLTVAVIRELESANVSYWLDFATLLKVLRQTEIPWDPDNDLSILEPPGVGRDAMLVWGERIFRTLGPIDYNPTRNLFQIPPAKLGRPHVDIWVWHEKADDPGLMWSIERTTHKQFRSKQDTFPLRDVGWRALNINASVPHDSHKLMLEEYGPGYLISYFSRADCLHNFVHGRFIYRTWASFLPAFWIEAVLDVSGIAALITIAAAMTIAVLVKASVWMLEDTTISVKRSL